MAWKTGAACGFTATRSSGLRMPKYSADRIAVIEAEEAWWPPTFTPSGLGRRWLAWWIIQLDNHKALPASASIRAIRSVDDMSPPKCLTLTVH